MPNIRLQSVKISRKLTTDGSPGEWTIVIVGVCGVSDQVDAALRAFVGTRVDVSEGDLDRLAAHLRSRSMDT